MLQLGPLTLIPDQRSAYWRGTPLQLTRTEYDLLALLAAHPQQAFRREHLLAQIWGAEYEGDIRTVDCHIKNLREKLEDGASIISTVWGVGYRFVPCNED